MNVKQYLPIALLIFILAVIYMTLQLVSQRQEIRNRAVTPSGPYLYFDPAAINVPPNQDVSVNINMDTVGVPIVGAEIHIGFDPTYFDAVSITKGTFLPTEVVPGQVGSGTASITLLSDPTNPVTGVGTIAILTLHGKIPNSTPVPIQFTTGTALSSLAQPGVNVLVAAQPGTVTIINPSPTPTIAPTTTPTPTPTATPRPTVTPTPTATPRPTVSPTATPRPSVSPTASPGVGGGSPSPSATPRSTPSPTPPTPTPSPSATPRPTTSPSATPRPTPTASPSTASIALLLKFQGVSVQRANQTVAVTVLPAGQTVGTPQSMTFVSNTTGIYTNVSPFGSFAPGIYTILVKGPAHLTRAFKQIALTAGTNTENFTATELLPGDLYPNELVDIYDYSFFVAEYGTRMPTSGSKADFDFDGDVDIYDYSFFVQNFAKVGETP